MSSTPISLDQLLQLVGDLNDQAGDNTPRDRFRHFLETSITTIGTVRNYVDVCLREKGGQYDRALQDLVNHAGWLMGFNVEFGRYQGVVNDIGHDGLWKANDFSIVVEVKTSDAFAIKTGTLLGYINALIDAGKIAGADTAIGLYVFGRPLLPEMNHLEASILQAGHSQRLRMATVDDILSLTGLRQQGLLTTDEVVALLRPVGVRVGSTVQLLGRIAAGSPPAVSDSPIRDTPVAHSVKEGPATSPLPNRPLYLLTPVADESEISAEQTIRTLLGQGVYVFADRTAGRKELKPGDKIAFYESGKGVVAYADIISRAERKSVTIAKNVDKYPWSFRVTNVRYLFDDPVIIDASLRSQLDAFAGKDPKGSWAWLVQGTRKITEHDFKALTRQ